MKLCGQHRRARRHDLHGDVFILRRHRFINRATCCGGDFGLRDVGRLAWIAQHRDVHRQNFCPLGADAGTEVIELLVLGVEGANYQNDRAYSHVVLPYPRMMSPAGS